MSLLDSLDRIFDLNPELEEEELRKNLLDIYFSALQATVEEQDFCWGKEIKTPEDKRRFIIDLICFDLEILDFCQESIKPSREVLEGWVLEGLH